MPNDNTTRRKQIRAYFFPLDKPDDGWKNLLIGGGVAFLLGLFFSSVSTVLGVLLILGGLLVAWSGASAWWNEYTPAMNKWSKLLSDWGLTESDLKTSPSGQQIDQWLQEDLNSVIDLALKKLGLIADELIREPMIIYGPLFWTTYGIPDNEVVYVKDKSGTLRFSCYQTVVVCLSEARIATYSANLNFLRYAFVGEKAIEFLYQDIVSVSTEEISTNYTLPNGKTLRRAQVFRLAVASRDNIEVVVNSPEIRDLLHGQPKLSSHDESVRVIREMLRTKKG